MNQGEDDGVESADVSDAEGGVHVDYAKITLLNEVEIAKQKQADQANITQAGGDQSSMLTVESQMFTKFIGRPPKNYEERVSFRKFTADHGLVSPLEKVTNEATRELGQVTRGAERVNEQRLTLLLEGKPARVGRPLLDEGAPAREPEACMRQRHPTQPIGAPAGDRARERTAALVEGLAGVERQRARFDDGALGTRGRVQAESRR